MAVVGQTFSWDGPPAGVPLASNHKLLAIQGDTLRAPTVDDLLAGAATLVGADLVSANAAKVAAQAAAASLTYASEAEAIDRTIENRMLNPRTIDHFLKQRLGYFPIERYSPDYSDLSQAFADAKADVIAAGGGIIRFGKSGQFKTGNIELPSNVLLMADGDVTLALHADIGSGNYLFKRTKQANPITTTVSNTSLSKGQTTITVASVTGISVGSFLTLESDEYYTGIPGVSGFGPEGKSERHRVKSISGLVLTLSRPLAENWDSNTYPVTVTVENLHRRIAVHGLRVLGTGVELSGPRFLDLDGVHDVMVDVAIDRCGNGATRLNNVDTFSIYGETGLLEGYNPDDVSKISEQYGAYQLQGVTNGLIQGLRGARLRRLLNLDKVDGSIIPRGVTCIGLHAETCLNGWGSHICSDVAFVSCRGDNAPFYYRGKDLTLVGCRISASGTSESSSACLLGNTDGDAFSEDPSLGHINIQWNQIKSEGAGIYARMSFDSGVLACNYLDVRRHGFWAMGKRSQRLTSFGNTFDRRRGVNGSSFYGFYFENQVANNLPLLVDEIHSFGDRFYNYVRAARVDGSSNINTGWSNITFEAGYQDYGNGLNASFLVLEGGFFGKNVGAIRCRAVGPLSEGFVALGPDRSYFFQMPFNHDNICLENNTPVTCLVLTSYSVGNRRTLVKGQRIEIQPPVAGSYREYDVLVSGTTGTFPSVTGSMTSGSPALVFASDPNSGLGTSLALYPGCFLTVTGAGPASGALTRARVLAWNVGTLTATLDTNAGTTVAATTVAYAAPTVKGSCMMES